MSERRGDPVKSDDLFLDALARGEDPSRGSDPLAGLLLGLREDVERPMPDAPQLPGEHEGGADVVSLDEARKKRYATNPWVAGLVGAAAASVAIVGAGSVLYSPMNKGETTMVELATTLDELEAASESGDADATRDLLEQARLLLASINETKVPRLGPSGDPVVVTVTRNVTTTKTAPEPPQPSTAVPAEPRPETAAPSQVPGTQTPGTGQAPTVQPGQPGQPGQGQGQPSQPSQGSQPPAPSNQEQPVQPPQPAPQPAAPPVSVHQSLVAPSVAPPVGVIGSSNGTE